MTVSSPRSMVPGLARMGAIVEADMTYHFYILEEIDPRSNHSQSACAKPDRRKKPGVQNVRGRPG
jgi:hypothetical protein